MSFQAPGYKLRWSTGEETANIQVSESGRYTVIISNEHCSKTETVDVLIRPRTVYKIPNVITPNGDTWNEYFEIPGLREPCRLLIYNRWGVQVYSSPNYQNDWQAQNQPDGTYFYKLYPASSCGVEQKGWVYVLRGRYPPENPDAGSQ